MKNRTDSNSFLSQSPFSRLMKACPCSLRSVLKTVMQASLILFAFSATPAVQAQTCENIPNPGTESLVAKISINGTNIAVADGAVIPSWTSLRFDSVIEATGSCTGMGWTSANPSSCEPNGYVWERVPNHTAITVDIATETGPLNFYVGLIYGTGGPGQHVINSAASDTTGPVYMTAGWKGTYTFHFNANINTTPCNLEPHVMEEQIITIRVGENDDATNNGPGSCEQDIANDAVGEPINVTNGNMYLQQTDYRLPGFGSGLDLTRTYNSKMQRAGLFGYGWSSFLDESIKTYNTKFLRLNLADGRAVYLARTNTTAPFVPVTSSDFHGQIVQNVDNTYTLTLKDGEVHQFDAAGKLVSLTDRNNNAITLSYTNGVPTTITDATGRTVTLTYDGSGSIASLERQHGNNRYLHPLVLGDLERGDVCGWLAIQLRHYLHRQHGSPRECDGRLGQRLRVAHL